MSELSQRIIDSSSMSMIMDYYGIQRKGTQYLCPFHNDHNPSMSIVPGDKAFKCWTCGEQGNVLNFIKEYEEKVNGNSMTWIDVYKKAISIQGLNITIEETPHRQLTAAEQRNSRLKKIMESAVNISKYGLTLDREFSKQARAYLDKRKISEATIKNFNIGIDYDSGLTKLLEKDKNKYSQQELLDVGLLREGSYGTMDTFNNRLLVPICDAYGKPVGFGGRVLGDQKPKYLNTSETELFHKSQILFNYHQAKIFAKDNEIVLVEGYFDVISAYEMGMKNTVALMGVALSQEQIKMIKQLNCDVVLSLDNDSAGRNAMLKIIPQLIKEELNVSIYDTSILGTELKDFGDFLVNGKSKEDIQQTRITVFEFLLKHEYFANKEINAENISQVYKKLKEDEYIKTSLDEIKYKEFIVKNSDFTMEMIEDMLHPKTIATGLERAMQLRFYTAVIGYVKRYAEQKNDQSLLAFVKEGKLTMEDVLEGLNNPEFISENGETIQIGKYVSEYIKKLPSYTEIKNDYSLRLKNILDNVYTFNKRGEEVRVWLTAEQKQVVCKQFVETFELDDDHQRKNSENSNIKNTADWILANPKYFTKLIIADSTKEFESLIPSSMLHNTKLTLMEQFDFKGLMGCIDYLECFDKDAGMKLEKMYPGKYTTENGELKIQLVFNNKYDDITLTPDNYISPQEKEENTVSKEKKIEEKIQQNYNVNKSNVSVVIPLTRGKYLITNRGVYIVDPQNSKQAIYIANDTCNIVDGKINLSLSSKNDMSLYNLPEGELEGREFEGKLTVKDFLKSFSHMYYNDINKEINK